MNVHFFPLILIISALTLQTVVGDPPDASLPANISSKPGKLIGWGQLANGTPVAKTLPKGDLANGFIQICSFEAGNGWIGLREDGTTATGGEVDKAVNLKEVDSKIVRIAAINTAAAAALDQNGRGWYWGPKLLSDVPPSQPLENLVDIQVSDQCGAALTKSGKVIVFGAKTVVTPEFQKAVADYAGEVIAIRINSQLTFAMIDRKGRSFRYHFGKTGSAYRETPTDPVIASPSTFGAFNKTAVWLTPQQTWYSSKKGWGNPPPGDYKRVAAISGILALETVDHSWKLYSPVSRVMNQMSGSQRFLEKYKPTAVALLVSVWYKPSRFGLIAITGQSVAAQPITKNPGSKAAEVSSTKFTQSSRITRNNMNTASVSDRIAIATKQGLFTKRALSPDFQKLQGKLDALQELLSTDQDSTANNSKVFNSFGKSVFVATEGSSEFSRLDSNEKLLFLYLVDDTMKNVPLGVFGVNLYPLKLAFQKANEIALQRKQKGDLPVGVAPPEHAFSIFTQYIGKAHKEVLPNLMRTAGDEASYQDSQLGAKAILTLADTFGGSGIKVYLTLRDRRKPTLANDAPGKGKAGPENQTFPLRNWTNRSGKVISGKLTHFEGGKVFVKASGKEIPIPISSLGEADLEYIQEWLKPDFQHIRQYHGFRDRNNAGTQTCLAMFTCAFAGYKTWQSTPEGYPIWFPDFSQIYSKDSMKDGADPELMSGLLGFEALKLDFSRSDPLNGNSEYIGDRRDRHVGRMFTSKIIPCLEAGNSIILRISPGRSYLFRSNIVLLTGVIDTGVFHDKKGINNPTIIVHCPLRDRAEYVGVLDIARSWSVGDAGNLIAYFLPPPPANRPAVARDLEGKTVGLKNDLAVPANNGFLEGVKRLSVTQEFLEKDPAQRFWVDMTANSGPKSNLKDNPGFPMAVKLALLSGRTVSLGDYSRVKSRELTVVNFDGFVFDKEGGNLPETRFTLQAVDGTKSKMTWSEIERIAENNGTIHFGYTKATKMTIQQLLATLK